MVRSSTLTEEPLINNIVHSDTVCTVGVTNFVMGLNPAGMALIKSIDPEVIFIDRFYHNSWAKQAMHHSRVTQDELRDVSGLGKLYEWMVEEAAKPSANTFVRTMLLTGLPYEVDVKESSPLVGWFYVLGVTNHD
jgi:hypothetical protein